MCAEENLLFDKTQYIFWITEPSIYFFNVFKITLYNNTRTMQFWVAITESGKILLHRNIYFSTVHHFYIRIIILIIVALKYLTYNFEVTAWMKWNIKYKINNLVSITKNNKLLTDYESWTWNENVWDLVYLAVKLCLK